jgi:hypothetical protein
MNSVVSKRINKSYQSFERAILPGLLISGILFLLWTNIQSLYIFPAPNSWIYWAGDETQSMSETQSQVTNGLYAYPNAEGSIFQLGSGIIKGSTWITSAIYGIPASRLNMNAVDVGRTISFVLGILLLIGVYLILRRNQVLPVFALASVVMLSSTSAFFIMSHSARPDILIGLAELILIAVFTQYPAANSSRTLRDGAGIAFLFLGGLLVSAHVWIDCALPISFLLWSRRIIPKWKVMVAALSIVVCGFVLLSLLFVIRTGKLDFWGPFDHVPIPLYHFFSPSAQRGNLLYRLFIVRQWSPYYIVACVLLGLGILVLKIKTYRAGSILYSWLVATALLAFSIVYFEAILPRYYIYLLPVLTVTMGLAAQKIWEAFSKPVHRFAYSSLGLLIVTAGMVSSIVVARGIEPFAETIAKSNRAAIEEARNIILRDTSPSKRVIVSTPALYGLVNSPNLVAITPLFLTAPEIVSGRSWPEADYIVTLNSTRVRDLIDNDHTYVTVFSGRWRKIFERSGVLTDIGRSYSQDGMWGDDTLRVYRINR